MTRYVWGNGDWIDTTGWKRPPRKTPYIVRDSMTPAVHPVTGDVLDSKSAFRAITREHGLTEIGNESPATGIAAAPAITKADVAQAYEMVEQGYTPPPNETVAPDTRILG
jgi:hypothetical protein